MIGDGLNSLIPPKKPDDPEEKQFSNGASSQNTPYPKPLSNEPNLPILNIPSAEDLEEEVFEIKKDSPIDEESLLVQSEPSSAPSPINSSQFAYSAPVRKSSVKRSFLNDAIFHIEVEKIKANPFQPRKYFDEGSLQELAGSIREFGILQPLVVTKIEKETETGTDVEYQLIAGERRLRAACLLGLERVPVIVRQSNHKEEELELAIIENIQRENLDLIETARAYARLQDEFNLTQREIAARVSKSREAVSNALRLLGLPLEIQDAVSQGQLTESHARLLLSIANPNAQKQLFDEILNNNLTVRQLKHRATKISSPGHPQRMPSDKEFEIKDLEEKLKEFLGTEVKIDSKGDGGKIVISFYSPEEIYGIIDKIHPKE